MEGPLGKAMQIEVGVSPSRGLQKKGWFGGGGAAAGGGAGMQFSYLTDSYPVVLGWAAYRSQDRCGVRCYLAGEGMMILDMGDIQTLL